MRCRVPAETDLAVLSVAPARVTAAAASSVGGAHARHASARTAA